MSKLESSRQKTIRNNILEHVCYGERYFITSTRYKKAFPWVDSCGSWLYRNAEMSMSTLMTNIWELRYARTSCGWRNMQIIFSFELNQRFDRLSLVQVITREFWLILLHSFYRRYAESNWRNVKRELTEKITLKILFQKRELTLVI